jgi:hypothetical protein
VQFVPNVGPRGGMLNRSSPTTIDHPASRNSFYENLQYGERAQICSTMPLDAALRGAEHCRRRKKIMMANQLYGVLYCRDNRGALGWANAFRLQAVT